MRQGNPGVKQHCGKQPDEAGNLVYDRQGYAYEYDYENRLTKIQQDGSDIVEYTYDALGRRMEKKDHVTSANTRRYFYSKDWQVLDEYSGDATPALENRFVYGNYIDEVLLSWATVTANSRYYVHDHLYSVAAEINTSSAVTERYEYDAYGNPHVLDSNFVDDSDNLPDNDNPYLFTGRRVDYLNNADLTLQYNRNRYYDYHTGRWLTHDPVGMADGLNLYLFSGNQPTGSVDPLGLLQQAAIELPTVDGTCKLKVRADHRDCELTLAVDGDVKWSVPATPGALSEYSFDYNWLSTESGEVVLSTCEGNYKREYTAIRTKWDAEDKGWGYTLAEDMGVNRWSAVARGEYLKYENTGDPKLWWSSDAAVWDSALRIYVEWIFNPRSRDDVAGLLSKVASPFAFEGMPTERRHRWRERLNPGQSRLIGGRRDPIWVPEPPIYGTGVSVQVYHRPPFGKWFIEDYPFNVGYLTAEVGLAKATHQGIGLPLWLSSVKFKLPGGIRIP